MVKSSRCVDDLEDLRCAPCGEAILRGNSFVPRSYERGESVRVLVLAHVTAQRRDLALELRRRIDGMACARSASHDPYLAGGVGFEAFVEERREREGIARVGIDRAGSQGRGALNA